MTEISNKTLATLLIVAIVVSLGGTLISLNKIGRIGGVPLITGFAVNDTGVVNFSIVEDITITVSDTNQAIEFLSGIINSSTGVCANNHTVLDSRNASDDIIGGLFATRGEYCGELNWSGDINDAILLRNDGSVFINVTVQAGSTNSTFICGGQSACQGTFSDGSPAIALQNYTVSQFITINWSDKNADLAEANSCDTGANALQSPITALTTSETNVCDSLRNEDNNDTIRFDVILQLPKGVVGDHTNTLTFFSSKSTDQTP